jgi:hypothetical protein
VEVLDGLDEVRLAQDHVEVFRLFDGYHDKLHAASPVTEPAGETVTGPSTGYDPYNELCATDDLRRKAAAQGALFGRDSG